MNDINLSAEDKLKEAAKKVFLEKGFDGTTTRDIAQEACMNGALLNYYFRSKEKLFALVFEELFKLFFDGMKEIIQSSRSLEEKIIGIIDHDFNLLKNNPGLTSFIHTSLQRNSECFIKAISIPKQANFNELEIQLNAAIAAGEVRPITIQHLMQLIVSNVQFIFQGKAMTTRMYQMDDKAFENFVEEHQIIVKEMICSYLFLKKSAV